MWVGGMYRQADRWRSGEGIGGFVEGEKGGVGILEMAICD